MSVYLCSYVNVLLSQDMDASTNQRLKNVPVACALSVCMHVTSREPQNIFSYLLSVGFTKIFRSITFLCAEVAGCVILSQVYCRVTTEWVPA